MVAARAPSLPAISFGPPSRADYRLCDLSAEDLLEERAALSGLTFVGAVGGTSKAPIHRYIFPLQDTDLRGDEDLRSVGGARFGHVEAISLENRTIDIKKRQDTANLHPEAVFAHSDRALTGPCSCTGPHW